MQAMSVGICGRGAASIKGLPRAGWGVWVRARGRGSEGGGEVRGHGQHPQSPPHSVPPSR